MADSNSSLSFPEVCCILIKLIWISSLSAFYKKKKSIPYVYIKY